MGLDQAVGRGAADEEGGEQDPEGPRLRRLEKDAKRGRRGGRTKHWRRALGLTERAHAEIGRAVAQQQQGQDKGHAQQGDDHHQRRAPAIGLRHAGDDRQEGQLAGGVRRRQYADDETALLRKPARRHRGAQYDRRHTRAGADHDAPA